MIKIDSFILMLSIFIFLIGASVGSFINMAAYRIPKNLSIIKPRSYCDKCKKSLSFFALIPIFGYFITRGKCAQCKTKIPFEYPIVEVLSGTFFLFAAYYYNAIIPLIFDSSSFFKSNSFIHFVTLLWLFCTGLLLSIIDLKHRILPDVIVIPGIFVSLLLGSLNPDLGFTESLLGILIGGFGLFIISKLYEIIRKKQGMGFGDVKYLAFLGGVLGWQGVLFTLFLASILGSFIGIGYLLFQRKALNTPIPFGPFLALAAVLWFVLSKNFILNF